MHVSIASSTELRGAVAASYIAAAAGVGLSLSPSLCVCVFVSVYLFLWRAFAFTHPQRTLHSLPPLHCVVCAIRTFLLLLP